MSLPVPHRRPHHPVNESDRAGIAGAVMPDDGWQKRRHELRLRREQEIDEELADSFPASDPPSWVHGTTPVRE